MQEQILNICGIAEKLQCSISQAEKLVKSGEVKATKTTGKWLSLESQVVEYVRRQL